MPWSPPPIETDQDAVTDRILDGLIGRIPGWEPVEGAPEVALAEEMGRETAITNATAVASIETAVGGIGETVFGLAALIGAQAEMPVTVTVTGAGAVIPAEFTVVGTTAAGVEVAFELPEAVVAADATAVVTMRARDIGAASNGVPAGPLTVVTATATVSAADAQAPSTGGVDPEPLEGYLSRLVDYIAILRPGGVRATDLAILARNVTGVQRALGVDLYDPATGTSDNERTATVFPIDADGQPVTAEAAAEVQAQLEAVREVNFIVHVAEPTYTPVTVEYTAVAEAGADAATVKANIDDAIEQFLDPARWGSTTDEPTVWLPGVDTVRYLDLARVAGSADGVAYLAALTLNGGNVDVALDQPAPLPAATDAAVPTTVTGTVQ